MQRETARANALKSCDKPPWAHPTRGGMKIETDWDWLDLARPRAVAVLSAPGDEPRRL